MPIDYKRYPPNWKTEIVPFVRERSGDCCEQCGTANKSVLFSVKVWLKADGKYKFKSIWFGTTIAANRFVLNNTVPKESNRPLIKPVRVVLTVAHLDHDETNWNVKMDRLKHMCQLCHLGYDAKEKYRRSLNKG